MRTIIAKYKPWVASAALMTIIIIASAHTAMAQSSVFTYQGRLIDDTLPSTGVYDFQFGLFDALTDGTEVIAPIDRLNVEVTGGAFTALLDFGFSSFTGQDRFLEIRVRQAGEIDFRRLTPRQQITSAPHALYSFSSGYAIQAMEADAAFRADSATNATTAENALQLGGIPANQYVQTSDPRLAPLPNSPLYIQNSTTPQASSNFNISGNGAAGGRLTGKLISATTQ